LEEPWATLRRLPKSRQKKRHITLRDCKSMVTYQRSVSTWLLALGDRTAVIGIII
jgi:hypothetical protein